MIKQLQERKKALQSVRKHLDGNAPLHTKDGLRHLRCLAMLVSTEMQIEELEGKAKRPLCESDRS